MIDLDRLIRQANDLEPLPATAARLAAIAADPDTGVREVVELVSFDQALTARLLRFANSAAVGSREPITTVQAAIHRLGTGTVVTVAMGNAVKGKLDAAVPAYGLGEGELWRHSVACALAVETLAAVGKVAVPGAAFTAALLHDVGKLVLARFLEPEILEVLREARQQGHLSPLEAESQVLGVHHAELGGLIAQHWQLPEPIVWGISHHHGPTDETDDDVAGIVRLADLLAHRAVPPSSSDPAMPEAVDRAATRVGVGAQPLERVEKLIAERLDERLGRYA